MNDIQRLVSSIKLVRNPNGDTPTDLTIGDYKYTVVAPVDYDELISKLRDTVFTGSVFHNPSAVRITPINAHDIMKWFDGLDNVHQAYKLMVLAGCIKQKTSRVWRVNRRDLTIKYLGNIDHATGLSESLAFNGELPVVGGTKDSDTGADATGIDESAGAPETSVGTSDQEDTSAEEVKSGGDGSVAEITDVDQPTEGDKKETEPDEKEPTKEDTPAEETKPDTEEVVEEDKSTKTVAEEETKPEGEKKSATKSKKSRKK